MPATGRAAAFYGYGLTPLQQCLATNGFLVVYSNPRGSGSYGRHFTQQVIEDWGGEDYLDLMAVVDAALQRPYVDRERTGIYGYSYGGFMTSWTIGQRSSASPWTISVGVFARCAKFDGECLSYQARFS